jgi:hypothetical protein
MSSENGTARAKSQPITTASRVDYDNEEAASAPSEFGITPDGGLNAWLVVAGGCAIFFCCLGFSNSFGTFIEYYMTHQLRGNSPDSIAWIGSLSLFLRFAAGAFGGPLFDLFGPWVCIPPVKLNNYFANGIAEYSTRCSSLLLCNDDAESVQNILAVHAGARHSPRPSHGLPPISSIRSCIPKLR